MRNSVIRIESQNKENRAFGTGFVVHIDSQGSYIVTCQHVIDDVSTPMVENILATIVSFDDTGIDMAVLFVPNLKLYALPLQVEECNSLDVEVIGFSLFNKKSVTQKKHIDAELFEKSMELFPKGKSSYKARQIKANNRFKFYSGNSGSPVICKQSSRVIAMVSNKEGTDIAYAVDIVNLQKVWMDMPFELLAPIEEVSGFLGRVEDSLWKRINIKKSFMSILLLLVIVVIVRVFPYTVEQKAFEKIEKKINKLDTLWEGSKEHLSARRKLRSIAKNLADSMKEDIDENYLIQQFKILKYDKASYAYMIASDVVVDKKMKKNLANESIRMGKIAIRLINNTSGNRKALEWIRESHVKDKVNLIITMAYIILVKEGETNLLDETNQRVDEIFFWYCNPNEKNKSYIMEDFLQTSCPQTQRFEY